VPGAPDPALVAARRVLLDALDALGEQRAAVILVGAQAIYLHTGEGDLAVAPFTLDADLALEPAALRPTPGLTQLLEGAGFLRTKDIGIWSKAVVVDGQPGHVTVDFLVPERLGGAGRRAARLAAHGERVARKVRGLEAAVVDRQRRRIGALEDGDTRSFEVAIAGPGALLVAKLHKLADRVEGDRASDKDALDVLRLLRAFEARALGVCPGK
jgi:Nucleotidyltransferase